MYAKITNGSIDQYPYTVARLRHDNPNTSFPRKIPDEMLADYGVVSVTVTQIPDYDERTQKLEQAAQPVEVNGAWLLQWNVANKTAEEIAQHDAATAESNRAKRNGLLAETDYLALTDNTLSAEMSAYRQALRDITTHANWPNLADGDWPTKP